MNKFEIVNDYGYKYDDVIKRVLKKILKEENVKNAIFTIILTDEDTIHKLNKDYRSIDSVTDVLSFAYEDNEKIHLTKERILGEIFICIPRMKEQALNYGHSETRELAFLCVHGLLHLLGYDHHTKEEEVVMFGIQERILNEFRSTRKEV
jgi:probable rRNA maturation factor